jgi:hypothetical protein
VIDAHLNFKYSKEINERVADLRRAMPRQHARSCLDQYHRAVKKGEINKGLRLLMEAARSAPREVFQPRRFAAVLKNGLRGMIVGTDSDLKGTRG